MLRIVVLQKRFRDCIVCVARPHGTALALCNGGHGAVALHFSNDCGDKVSGAMHKSGEAADNALLAADTHT